MTGSGVRLRRLTLRLPGRSCRRAMLPGWDVAGIGGGSAD
jgi:hypothetical protein